ncbi:hypothetical protein ACJQWK_00068 [Exserohilum turcicum]|uniref:Heterokaryon incompatibility domain-containing protein n=1 Tax=Exserohilum turcicum (strain 28A) TaxID=671987 RepID=R0K0J9_EXST2|nr:uncharacterized protein SETTUDRAFT_33523 [Exserohilum turcica Et28A]EOA83209.1 hypothetical protein SETTUDRAFT_33523 [Exserohilum turcica Et28A]
MDRIYAGAYVTVVACVGEDADYGLPGVSRRREVQPCAMLPEFNLAASLPPLSTAMRNSKRMTRGWTYQEAMLSRRCLFFTNKQVYFVCPNMGCCESLLVHSSARQSYHDDPWQVHTSLSTKMFEEDSYAQLSRNLWKHHTDPSVLHFGELMNHFLQYIPRQLTHQEDILDAFHGLLNRSSFYSYYGVVIALAGNPIAPGEFEHGFIRGLFWTTVPDLQR